MTDTATSQLVNQLTTPHQHVQLVGGHPVEGTELPLLQLLHQAIGSTTTPDGGKGGGGTPSVIDADALALWASIRQQVKQATAQLPAAQRVPDHGKAYELQHTVLLLRVWHRAVSTRDATMAEAVDLYARCHTWVNDIRNHFDPEKKVGMRGQACGTCGVKTYKGEGGTRGPAVVLHLTRPAPVAVCQACGETWTGGELLDLKAGKPAAQQSAPATPSA